DESEHIHITGSADHFTATWRETLTDNFNDSESESGPDAPTDASDSVNGFATYTLDRTAVIDHGTVTLPSTTLDVDAAYTDDDLGRIVFHIHVTGNPNDGFTTEVTPSGAAPDAVANLQVAVGTGTSWLPEFAGTIYAAIQGQTLAAMPSQGGGAGAG